MIQKLRMAVQGLRVLSRLCALTAALFVFGPGTVAQNTELNLQPQNGDLRLVGVGSDATKGRVEIFIDRGDNWRAWGTLCGSHIGTYLGDVICHQLGYGSGFAGRVSEGGKYPYNTTNVPIWLINDWKCDRYTYNHVLRCVDYKHVNPNPDPTAKVGECDHEMDLFVECSQETMATIDKTVRLCSRELSFTYTSVGLVELFLYERWGTVTVGDISGSHFDKIAADTVCRQLGYTSANMYGAQWNKSTIFETSCQDSSGIKWFRGSNCTVNSPCFSCCYDYPIVSCGSDCDINYAMFVQCRYDISEADNEKSPAEAGVDCSKVTPANSVCHARKLVAKGWVSAAVVFILISVAMFVILLCICLCACYRKNICRRRNYDNINVQAD